MDFDQIIDRRGTDSIKWNIFGDDILPMWIADMDFQSPEPVIKALHERIDHGIFGYGCLPEGLRQAIKKHLMETQHWSVDEEEISFISGVVTGFNHAIYSLTLPGDKVMIQTPVYPPFLVAPKLAGRECVHNNLIHQKNGRYEIDFDDFEANCADGVKLFILCNPHNPVGRVFSETELTKMAEICLRHRVTICSDEIHSDLIFSGHQHIPIASLSPEVAKKTVTYFAPSKTFNIAGFSTSVYVAKDEEMRKTLSSSMKMLLGHPNILGLHAANAAYRDGRPWLMQVLKYLESNRDYLYERVLNDLPGVKMWKPEGTYLGWLDCRQLGLECSAHKYFLDQAKVALNAGGDFGESGKGFVRLNFACPRVLLTQALDKMQESIQNERHRLAG
jgi:cystathionine beta-lyase